MENEKNNLVNIKNAASEPISFLIEKEYQCQKTLNDYKSVLKEKLEEISLNYKEKLNKIQSDCQKAILEIPQTYKKDIEEIENEYRIRLEDELKKIEQEWIKNKAMRESLFLETIQKQNFYD